MLELNSDNILDKQMKDNLEKLSLEFMKNPFLNGDFKHFEISILSANSEYRFRHSLNYTPSDILITYISNNSAVEILYDQIDNNFVVFNFPSACTIRFLAGKASRV